MFERAALFKCKFPYAHINAYKLRKFYKEEKIKKSANFQTGDKVRITTGLLSGKVGIIENIDAKAMVKVAVGKMSVKVPGQDLIPLA